MVKLVAATPLKATCVAPIKLLPVIVTGVPTGPRAGVKVAMNGGGATLLITKKLSGIAPSMLLK